MDHFLLFDNNEANDTESEEVTPSNISGISHTSGVELIGSSLFNVVNVKLLQEFHFPLFL